MQGSGLYGDRRERRLVRGTQAEPHGFPEQPDRWPHDHGTRVRLAVAEDHQTKNAKAISDHDAAILLKEKNIDQLESIINTLLDDTAQRKTLSDNIKKMAKPNATTDIVNEIKKHLL